jgi:MOSC domain-containing protein YiiM
VTDQRFSVAAVLTGHVASFGPKGEPSGMAKMPVSGAVTIGPLGLLWDEQADLVHHGGQDKAIHHYPYDHYPFWQAELLGHALLAQAGAFGENISTIGLVEDMICIGDRYRLGTALVEVSQGRQPCWKLGHRFGDSTVPARVVSTGKSGWYYRVIEAGMVGAGDTLALQDRPYPNWSVALVFNLLLAGGHKREPTLVRALKSLAPLAESWRHRAHALAD